MNDENDDCSVTTLTFGLFPDTNLKVGLFASASQTPQELTSQLSTLDSVGERFALLDATRIISLNHVGIAANSALLRLKNFRLLQEEEEASSNTPAESKEGEEVKKRKRRGIATETIVCCGGSTNIQSVLKDFGFVPPPVNPPKEDGTITNNYILLGYNCSSDEEFFKVAHDIGFTRTAVSTKDDMNAFFSRKRSIQETKDLIKVYKLTTKEIEMNSSSLEKAIINRVASKFYI